MSAESLPRAPPTAPPDSDEEPTTIVGMLRAVLLARLREVPRTAASVRFFQPKTLRPNWNEELRSKGIIGAAKVSAPMLAVNSSAGLALFSVYDHLHSHFARPGHPLDASVCGFIGGIVHAAVVCPLGALLSAKLHRPTRIAFGIFLLRDTIGFGAFFGTFDAVLTRTPLAPSPCASSRMAELRATVVAGGAAGGVYHLWSAPFEYGKSQSRPSLRALALELRRQGFRDVLKGARGTIGGAALASSLSFSVAQLMFDHELRSETLLSARALFY
jgi:hypothetical protein